MSDDYCNGNCDVNKTYPDFIKHVESCKIFLKRMYNALRARGISRRSIKLFYGDSTVSLLTDTPALSAVKYYLEGGYKNGDCLVLSGGTGTGKTLAASYALQEIYGKLLYSADLQKLFLDDTETKNIKAIKFLVIDDLGIEYKQDWFNSNFDSLINYRCGNMLATIITTNLSVADFKNIYSARIISRLREWGEFIQLGNSDMRKGLNTPKS